MALSFGASFKSEFDKFLALKNPDDFLESVVPFVQFAVRCIEDKSHPYHREINDWRVTLFNGERHQLYPHQVIAIQGCFEGVIVSEEKHSGYCFMPTSAGKGHILMTLAGLAVGDYSVHKLVADAMPDVWNEHKALFPILISLGLEYSKLVADKSTPRTQILVHDTAILDQLSADCADLMGAQINSKIEFHSVQALRNPDRRKDLKYVIIDECHWGNATEEETIQSSLIADVVSKGGKALGFTASPYSDGKFQRTWSENEMNSGLGFNYYLDNKILYPVTLREVNLQNARVGFTEGADELDLTEKDQVIEFMADHISTTLPPSGLDGPAICFFSSVIIPDIVEALYLKRPDLKPLIKVFASESAFFAEKCAEMFGPEILATEEDIKRLKRGEKIFLISRQRLLVGLNAPFLRYCFVSPTNSKITIMQAIGRLMRPIDFEKVPKKLATLFLTSLSGKKLDITGKGGETKPVDEPTPGHEDDPDGIDSPKTRYTTTSMTLSEAYNLPTPVFYKTEVGFKDFINQTRIKDGNTVEVLKRKALDPEEVDRFDPMVLKEHLSRIRDMARAQYKKVIMERDSRESDGRRVWYCHGKQLFGERGCDRTSSEVRLEIHHLHPYTFASLFQQFGPDGVLAWHSDPKNLQHLVTLCEVCHDLAHAKEDGEGEVA